MQQFFKFVFASCLGVLLSMLVLGFFMIAVGGALAASFGGDEGVTVKSNSVLEVSFNSQIPEKTNNVVQQGGFTVEVNTADGTATVANNDYNAITNQPLVFSGNANETNNVTLTPQPDAIIEGDENLVISMSNLSNTTLTVDISDTATVTILNDDSCALSKYLQKNYQNRTNFISNHIKSPAKCL